MNNETMTQNKKHFSKIGFRYLIGTILISVVQSIAMVIMGALGKSIPAIAEDYTYTFLATMLSMYIIGFPVMALLLKKVPAQDIGEKKKMSALQLIQAVFMSLALLYFFNLIGQAITMLIGTLKQDDVTNVLGALTASIHPLANLFIIAICAPIVEELLFRKILIERTIKYGEFFSAIFSAFVFALYHGNLNQFIYAIPLGCFFAFIYIKTRNIRYTIILHMIVNFFGSFVSQTLMDYSETLLGIYGIILIMAMIVGLVLLLVHRKKLTLLKTTESGEKAPGFKTAILNWGMGLYTILWTVVIIVMLFA